MIELVTDPYYLTNYCVTGEPLNVCSRNAISVEKVLEIICNTIGVYPKLNWVGEKWVDQKEVKSFTDFDMMPPEEAVEKATREIWQKINS